MKKTLLAAKSIGYSTGPSGNYLLTMFDKLGIADQVKPKLKQTPTGVFVGTITANREVEIGFQQVSEMATFAGVDYVGPLPAEVQQTTIFSSGIWLSEHRETSSSFLSETMVRSCCGVRRETSFASALMARVSSPISSPTSSSTLSRRFSVKSRRENMRFTLASLMPRPRATWA